MSQVIRYAPAVLVATAVGLFAIAAYAQEVEGGRPLSAHLTGAAEKPKAGDPDGQGHASFRVNVGQNQVCYELAVEKIAVATAAHIHKGGPDAAGPPVVPLKAPAADGKVKDCATADAAVVKDILQNPAMYYVNVHNAEFPAGAVRGQLGK
ncbi:CHRD domain-containing protein [Phenylobacterium sp. VNQ135]|uniref:CHRD domain-containing protein n=1 Tax=Phenylobacterium sp. VNQ135 TaxID=3400922 RepID=UPI003C0B36C5